MCVISLCPFFQLVGGGEVAGDCFRVLGHQFAGSPGSGVHVLMVRKWPIRWGSCKAPKGSVTPASVSGLAGEQESCVCLLYIHLQTPSSLISS